ncbi:hypothetical protein IQ07DRAFT_149481 [Pyrenochaeta sp. DS3sAY3a]|nr:hypothetical protein IQ07DRAFT_149481 [Pyrenochaeta sp. DS3sAY3a]
MNDVTRRFDHGWHSTAYCLLGTFTHGRVFDTKQPGTEQEGEDEVTWDVRMIPTARSRRRFSWRALETVTRAKGRQPSHNWASGQRVFRTSSQGRFRSRQGPFRQSQRRRGHSVACRGVSISPKQQRCMGIPISHGAWPRGGLSDAGLSMACCSRRRGGQV